MERTPEEIKKGLECCGESQDCTQDNMPKCPYYEKETCLIELVNDALSLIQQLQDENAEKDKRIRQLEAEWDAAMDVLRGQKCDTCEYRDIDTREEPCLFCRDGNRWQWRGIQKKEE